MILPEDAQALAARVSRSFLEVPAPDRITVLPAEEDFESALIMQAFRGKHWSELTPELVQGRPEAIAFLSPEAFRFFLPGYLLIAIQDLSGLDVSLIGLLYAMAGPIRREERFQMLSEEQLLTVLSVLEALTPEEEDPMYWDFERAKEGVLEYLTRPGERCHVPAV